jgi:Zn-dependent peptidase ImmA (M78 family)/transcriptional regulator with XRE-family HTH domain
VSSSVAAVFDPARLELARLARGRRKNQLATIVGVTPAAISQYERGTNRPSGPVVAKLALALGVPVEFFAESRSIEHVYGSAAHFRSLRSTSQMDRNKALAQAIITWDVVQVLERHVQLPARDLPTVRLPESPRREDVESIAADLRAEWQLPIGPISNVIRLLESHGVVVTRLTLGTSRVDAFSVDFGRRPVVVLSDDKNDKARSRLDGAHELGHLVMHYDAEPGDRVVEQQAQMFASAFLLPEDLIADQLPRRVNWPQLLQLKRTWGVSLKALLYRSRVLGVIAEPAYRRAMTTMSSRGWHRAEPGDLGPAERPVLLQRSLELLGGRGYLLENLAAEVRWPPEELLAIAALEEERPVIELDTEPEGHSVSNGGSVIRWTGSR